VDFLLRVGLYTLDDLEVVPILEVLVFFTMVGHFPLVGLPDLVVLPLAVLPLVVLPLVYRY
jgi:hypothetical protein